jgi:hypothetical protein
MILQQSRTTTQGITYLLRTSTREAARLTIRDDITELPGTSEVDWEALFSAAAELAGLADLDDIREHGLYASIESWTPETRAMAVILAARVSVLMGVKTATVVEGFRSQYAFVLAESFGMLAGLNAMAPDYMGVLHDYLSHMDAVDTFRALHHLAAALRELAFSVGEIFALSELRK